MPSTNNMSLRCELCGHNNKGKQYTFFVGKTLSRSYQNQGIAKITNSTYLTKGPKQAFICDHCVSRYKRKKVFYFLTSLSAALLLFYLVYLTSSFTPMEENYVGGISFIIAGIFGLASFLVLISMSEPGASIAIKIKKQEYQMIGFDQFWTPNQYSNLSKSSKVSNV